MAHPVDTVASIATSAMTTVLIISVSSLLPGDGYYVGKDLHRGGGIVEMPSDFSSSMEMDNGLGGGGAGVGRYIKHAVVDCSVGNGSDSGLACFGARMLEKTMDSLLSKKRYRFSDELEIVEVGRGGGRSLGAEEDEMDKEELSSSPFAGVIRKMKAFLGNHEIRLRFPRLSSLPLDIRSVLNNETLPAALELLNRVGFTRQVMASVGTGRGKNKGGGALAAAMLMSAATIGAVGLKGIGLLALKALALSSAAFVISLIAALKKLLSKDDEGGGGHYVQYVPVHSSGHHGRSLDLTAPDLAYREHVPK